MPLSIDEVYAIVKPYLDLFYWSQIESFKYYNSLAPEDLVQVTPRSRASAVHDLIVECVKERLEGDADVRITDHQQLVLFTIKDLVSVRFKKLGEGFRSMNIQTQQVFDFWFYRQYELPGIPRTVHLEAGYRLNHLQTEIDGAYLVWPEGNQIRKVWDLEAQVGQKTEDNLLEFARSPKPPEKELFKPNKEAIPKKTKEDNHAK